MTPDDITGDLLRSVSRTMYLSIRVLPAPLREAMGVAYLLARTSDTIADSAAVPLDVRLARLDDFAALLAARAESRTVAGIEDDIRPDHPGERALLAALPRVCERFAALPDADRGETRGLLATIIAAQRGDLVTFSSPGGGVIALADARALDAYAHGVAGCVGEWWTTTCIRHIPRYSARSERDLLPLADSFGKGLQLVNILRDLPVDLRAGRCYLPRDELHAAGADPATILAAPAAAEPVVAAWMARARDHLRAGREYIRGIRARRVRVACYVPWRLAVRTLDHLESTPPLAGGRPVKVSRGTVYRTLLGGLVAAVSDLPLR